ncbi:glycosyltransferase [Acinetobacter radioresistens]|uniref:glycosyltransferase n=1 Tax=Acinetobacter radioresistens TaxID=40216 RepID=UPI002246C1CC|nr:glycosyltransferase [Acinetobacter radioresistens]MCX0339645.1 glycosyltransferase [Acinetobacter radioresistens]
MKDKVDLIYFDFVGTFGGAQQSTSTLINYLNINYSNIKCKVYIVPNTNEDFLASISTIDKENINIPFLKNFNIFNIKRNFILAFLYILICSILIIFKKNNNAVFLCNTPKALLLLSIVKFFKAIEINYYCRGWGNPKSFNFITKILLKKNVKKIYCVSNNTKNNLATFINIKKLYVTYTSVNLDYLTSISQESNNFNQLNFSSRYIKILFAGAIIETKGLHTLLESLILMNTNEREGFKIFIAGKINKNSSYYKYCNNLIVNNQLDVYWLGWVKEIPSLIRKIDIICLPSYTEGMPRIIQEGMVLEKICVTTPVGGIPDLIINNETGYLFKINDSKNLKNILLNIDINNKNIVKNAKKLVYSKFNLKVQASLFVRCLLDN